MTTSLTPPEVDVLSDEGATRLQCVACAHDLADHDAVGLRYCQATQAQARSRNCICRSH